MKGASVEMRGVICVLVALSVMGAGCSSEEAPPDVPGRSDESTMSQSAAPVSGDLDGAIDIGDGRRLYVRCTGTGSPTVIMEAGDGDVSDTWYLVEPDVAAVTRTCVYDRANLGRSSPAAGPRGLSDLVGDLQRVLQAAEIPAPYVLVATSGGGYIAAGYAEAHPNQIAGIVLIDTGSPFRDPPPRLIAETAWDSPTNVEQRDYLQVEQDAWRARRRIGDIPVTIVTVDYGSAAQNVVERRNVEDQKGWLVLSPRAEQVLVHTGHVVHHEAPALVIDVIRDVVSAAR